MTSATTPNAWKPPSFCGSITQVTIVTPSVRGTSRAGPTATFQCGCRWRTSSSSSASTSSGNGTRSAYVQDVTGRDAMVAVVSRSDHQLTVGVDRDGPPGQRLATGQQHAHVPADRRTT